MTAASDTACSSPHHGRSPPAAGPPPAAGRRACRARPRPAPPVAGAVPMASAAVSAGSAGAVGSASIAIVAGPWRRPRQRHQVYEPSASAARPRLASRWPVSTSTLPRAGRRGAAAVAVRHHRLGGDDVGRRPHPRSARRRRCAGSAPRAARRGAGARRRLGGKSIAAFLVRLVPGLVVGPLYVAQPVGSRQACPVSSERRQRYQRPAGYAEPRRPLTSADAHLIKPGGGAHPARVGHRHTLACEA